MDFDDAKEHQKAERYLNALPRFLCYSRSLDGKRLAIYHFIGEGKRPYWPLSDEGKLSRNVARVRRGTGTANPAPRTIIDWYPRGQRSGTAAAAS